MTNRVSELWAEILEAEPRFSLSTYLFIQNAMVYANITTEEETEQPPSIRLTDGEFWGSRSGHVSPKELCWAAVHFAVARYGYLAKMTLAQLGLRKTEDIGDAVYNLVEFGLLTQSDEDSREDFDNLFDLGEELDKAFHFQYREERLP